MSQDIISLLNKTKIDKSWSFSDKTRKDTAYITHGYHRYPAKFIPQIVSRLEEKYTKQGDFIVDPFGGCGTTMVESKVMGRPSIAVDINPVAVLITKAKITPINPIKIEKELTILKNSSIWLQKSNKPTRDFEKNPSEPTKTFFKQVKMMLRGNAQLFTLLSEKGYLKISSKVICTDARTIPAKDNSISLIVTSPPYVTSYEYADLHQLTALWLEYTKDLSDFRKRFIGTSYHSKKCLTLNSSLAESIR